MIFGGLIVDFGEVLIDIKLGQAVIDGVPGEEIDSPGEFFLNLGNSRLVVPEALLPLPPADLPVSTSSIQLCLLMRALDLSNPVRTFTLPSSSPQTVLAEALVCLQLPHAYAVLGTFYWLFHA